MKEKITINGVVIYDNANGSLHEGNEALTWWLHDAKSTAKEGDVLNVLDEWAHSAGFPNASFFVLRWDGKHWREDNRSISPYD